MRAGVGARVALILFSLLALVFLITLSDRDGYEGDDLNSIVPMFHLEAAKEGSLLIYRYAWQPLSYELGAAVFQTTKQPAAIFLLAPISGALSLLLLLLITWCERASFSAFAASLVAVLAIPELWFSGLYYNSTILGLPFALASLALLKMQRGVTLAFIAGILAGVAILMRIDFALAFPALVLVTWLEDRSFARPTLLSLGVVVTLVLAFLGGLIDPAQIVEIHRSSSSEIAAKADMPGWDMRTKLGVLSVVLSPVGWAILLLGGPLVAYQSFRRDPVTTLLWSGAVLPMAIPLMNALSAKYFLPLAMFVAPFLVQCLSAIERSLGPWPLRVAAAATVALFVVSLSIVARPPFVHVGTFPARTIGTHDGARSYGGYLWQAASVDRFAPPSDQQLAADRIRAEFLWAGGPDIIVAGGENYFASGGVGWRHLQLALEQEGVRGKFVGPHQIQFERNGRRLTLIRDVRQDTLGQLERGRGIQMLDLRGS